MGNKPLALKLGIVLFAVLLAALAGIWYLKSQEFTSTVASIAEQEAARLLETKIKIDAVTVESVNSLQVKGIAVYDKQGELLLQADSARVHFSPLAMLQESPLKGIDKVAVRAPHIIIEQRPDGKWNYEDIISPERKKTSDFTGTVSVEDGTVTGRMDGKELTVDNVAGTVDFARYPALQITGSCTNNAAAVSVSGTIGGSRQMLSLTGENIAVTQYLDFVPAEFLQDITIKAGTIKKVEATVSQAGSDDMAISGQAELAGGSVAYQDKTAEDINALLVFNEKETYVFSHATVQQQPLALHGKVHFDAGAMYMNLIAESPGFDPGTVLADIPFQGKVAFAANVTGTLADPAVAGDFTVKHGEVYGYDVSNARAKAKFIDNVLFVDELTADVLGGTITAQGQINATDLLYNGHIQAADIDAAALSEFVPEASGRIRADIGLNGQGKELDHVEIYGTAAMQAGDYQGVGFDQLQSSFYKNGDRITVDYLSAALAGGGEFGLEGTIDGESLDLDFHGLDFDLALLAQLAPQADISGLADFKGHLRGSLANPAVRADFAAKNGKLFKQPYELVLGSAAGSLDGVYIRDFAMINGGRVTHKASGIVGFSGAKKIDLHLETKGARMENLAALLLPDQPITGNVDNTLHLTGTLDDIQAQGHIHFYEGSYRGILLTGADGDYTRQNGVVTLRDFYATSPLVNLRLSGIMDSANNLNFAVTADDVHLDKINVHLPYPVSGRAKFSGTLTGNTQSPIFIGNLQADELVLNDQKITGASGRIEYRSSLLYLKDFGFRQNGGDFKLSGFFNPATQGARGNINVKNADINALLAMVNYKNDVLSGRLDGAVDFSGTYDNPSAHLQGSIAAGTLKDYPLSNIAVDVSLANRIVTINKFFGEQGLGKVAALGTIDLDGPISARLSAQDIDARLLSNLMNAAVDLQGTLNVDAQFGGTLADPAADVSVDIENGGAGTATFDSLTGLLNLSHGIINVNQVLLKKGPYKASAYGIVPLKALESKPWEMPATYDQINLRVGLDQADLSILPMLSPQVDWAMGPLKGGVMITGTLAHPYINGNIKAADGAIKFKHLKKPLQNIQVDVDFMNERMTVNAFSGLMGGGSYNLTGSTLITGGGFAKYDFQLVLDKLGIDSDFFQGPLSGQIALNTAELRGRTLPQLVGSIKLENATISLPTLPDTAGSLPNMIIDLSLDLGDKARLYSPFLYDLNIKGSARFVGTTRHPQPSGEITVTRGTVSYLKTVFQVRDAVAYFNQVDSFFPEVHLGADTKIDRTKVYFMVDGPANQMGVKLGSDSDMSDTEIIQLLTLRSRYQSGKDGSSDLTSLFDIGLRMSFLSEVDTLLRRTMNVDQFNIVRDTLSANSAGGSQAADKEVYNVEIGKYLSDKYMLKYTKGIGYSNDKIGIQYEINDHINLSGSAGGIYGPMIGIEAKFKF